MNGSHWVATYVKKNKINNFDSFGMPPFQEIVDHAKSKNLTLVHQDNQIQNIMTTTCGYFCLYFLNEMNKGTTYYDLLEVFDIRSTMKNERFIEKYFKIVQSIYMNKFCVYCQEVTPHYVNEYGCLKCCNCAQMSYSEYEDSDSSSGDETYVPESESDIVYKRSPSELPGEKSGYLLPPFLYKHIVYRNGKILLRQRRKTNRLVARQ